MLFNRQQVFSIIPSVRIVMKHVTRFRRDFRAVLICLAILQVPSSRCAPADISPLDGKYPYACIPSTAAIVLSYFDKQFRYQELCGEMEVRATGFTTADHLPRVFDEHGLHWAVYQNLSFDGFRDYLKRGFPIVLVFGDNTVQHATCAFDSPEGVLVADLRSPLHVANSDALRRILSDQTRPALCVVIGSGNIPTPDTFNVRALFLGLIPVAAVTLIVLIVRLKKGVLAT